MTHLYFYFLTYLSYLLMNPFVFDGLSKYGCMRYTYDRHTTQ